MYPNRERNPTIQQLLDTHSYNYCLQVDPALIAKPQLAENIFGSDGSAYMELHFVPFITKCLQRRLRQLLLLVTGYCR